MRHQHPDIQLLIEYLYGLFVISGPALQNHTNDAMLALSTGSVHFANASILRRSGGESLSETGRPNLPKPNIRRSDHSTGARLAPELEVFFNTNRNPKYCKCFTIRLAKSGCIMNKMWVAPYKRSRVGEGVVAGTWGV